MTTDEVAARLWDSAYDFQRVVLPYISSWLPEGRFVSIEDAPDHPAVKVVDTVGGIDGWLVSERGTRLQGIASRVQYGTEPFESFTIRARLPTGAPTELAKRLEALRDVTGHFVVPHYTVQAWVERRRTGRLLLVVLVLTRDLFEFVAQHPDDVEHRFLSDGTEFLVVWTHDLHAAGYKVMTGGAHSQVIRLRGGETWMSPSEEDVLEALADAEEEEVVGYWEPDEGEDEAEECMYCASPLVQPGERCPACYEVKM